jgi:hypothetical protein
MRRFSSVKKPSFDRMPTSVQAGVAARFEQGDDVAAQRPGLARMALEQLAQRAHLGARVSGFAHAARAQLVDQVDQQVDAVAVGIEAFENV